MTDVILKFDSVDFAEKIDVHTEEVQTLPYPYKYAEDSEVERIADEILIKYRKAFEELAKR